MLDAPTVLGYTLASGENGYPGFTTLGHRLRHPQPEPVAADVGHALARHQATCRPDATGGAPDSPPCGSTFWEQWVKYFVTRDPAVNSLALDPEDPGPWQARIVELTGIQDANRTDCSAFQGKGGKILMAHGAHDALVSARAMQQFLNRVRGTMGVAGVDSFLHSWPRLLALST